jgi:hypothetical protein
MKTARNIYLSQSPDKRLDALFYYTPRENEDPLRVYHNVTKSTRARLARLVKKAIRTVPNPENKYSPYKSLISIFPPRKDK